ncbi:unnamed protein product [Sphagnum jensenii]|uniref:Uncharacterized protein n=1 Tax=Sphagnum jensenii TaxID=128206 RepID=A0ABP0X0H5_9BRYO
MTGRALGSVEYPNWEASEAEKSTELYNFRTDTWTDSGDLCGGLRLAKNSSSAYYKGLVLTVAYGPVQDTASLVLEILISCCPTTWARGNGLCTPEL